MVSIKKVLNIVSGAPSGALNVAITVAEYLGKYFHCDILLRKYNKAGITNAIVVRDRFVFDYILRLCQILKVTKPDIILVHGFSTHLWTKVAAGIKKVKLIHVEHNVERYNFFRAVLLRLLDKYTDRYVCVSQGVANHLIKLGIRSEKIEVILNGINPDQFTVEKQPQQRFTIGMTARFSKQKDQMTLIRAVEYLVQQQRYDLHLILQGDGKMRKVCQEYVIAKNLDNHITFEKGRFVDLAPRLDLFVLSTNYEGFGLVVCEAMAAKIPVIASCVPGVDEIIIHDENGFMVEPGNFLALANYIEKFLQDDFQNKRYEIVSAAEKHVQEKFHLNNMLKKYKELIT